MPPYLAAAFWLARVLVLDNIRKAIGVHRARLLITGAAPTSPDLIRWYMALGLEMVEVWGQTESGGISTSNPIGRVQARLDRHAVAANGGQGFAGRRAAGARPVGVHGLPEPAGENRRDACATAGCTPAMSGAWTTTATSTSPTG